MVSNNGRIGLGNRISIGMVAREALEASYPKLLFRSLRCTSTERSELIVTDKGQRRQDFARLIEVI